MTLFLRIFLVTFGLLFAGGGGFVLYLASAGGIDLHLAYSVLASVVAAAGIAFVLAGLLCRPRTVEQWSDAIPFHEASLIIVVIAMPIFLIAKLLTRLRLGSSRSSAEVRGHGFQTGQSKRSRRRNRG